MRSLLVPTLLFGCSAPAPAATSLSLVSERGLIDAEVQVETPVARGDNTLLIQLKPHQETGTPELVAVDASMPAHAHSANAPTIVATGDGFQVSGLDLFMTGRWLVVLQLSLDGQSDSASLPVDVP
jgi:hypothetical protein